MNKFDYLRLDGRSLQVFLMVLEEGSVTQAARRLDVTQSAVSHTLDKLRAAFGDPLLVRSGRGIQSTERARSLREPVQRLLDDLKALTHARQFDPADESMEFAIAANDVQRDLIFPPLARSFDQDGIDVRFRFLAAGVPSASLLHDARCQYIVTPFPPDGTDILQKALFEDQMVCFFDEDVRDAPRDWDSFVSSDHIEVRFPNETSALAALGNVDRAALRTARIQVPNLGDISAFMKGTALISTQISAMKLGLLSQFEIAKLPFYVDPVKLYLVWHRRDDNDPAHAWLRERITETANKVASSLPAKSM